MRGVLSILYELPPGATAQSTISGGRAALARPGASRTYFRASDQTGAVKGPMVNFRAPQRSESAGMVSYHSQLGSRS